MLKLLAFLKLSKRQIVKTFNVFNATWYKITMIKEKLKRGSILYKLYLYFNIFIRYKILKANRKTHSQFGEDLFIKSFFLNQKIGKYVDLGAFHPMRLSNTYLLYKNGWSGTNVDLNPITIDLFDIARSKDKNICCLIGEEDGLLKDVYYEDWSAANSLTENENLKDKKQMKTRTFENLINHDFDFLNIDLEGHDYEILKTINFKKFNPKLICIEILKDCSDKENIFKFMEHNRFIFIKNLGPSYFFKKEQK